MRWARIVAVARRDLRIEFAGRRVPILPAVAAFLLLPIALTPPAPDSVQNLIRWRVWGDVPEAVLAVPHVVLERAHDSLRFEAPSDDNGGQWLLRGAAVPTEIREVMDAGDPQLEVHTLRREPIKLPARSLFLSLVSASILMGALSQSIPGERAAGTLATLLTAAITRTELVTGKWLAWGGFGAASAMLAVAAAVLRGAQPAGWWILAVPWVSLGTVAMGFFLVRRANDVIGGATVAIRMLPVALAVLGLLAWYLGSLEPYLGASVPIGGALLASGATWPGAGPTLWACASTALCTAAMLVATARDLDTGEQLRREAGLAGALVVAAIATVAWWTPVLGALLWTAGGAPERTETVPMDAAITGGVLGLLLLVLVRLSRDPQPARAAGWFPPPTAIAWAGAGVAAAALAAVAWIPLPALPVDGIAALAAGRLDAAVQPGQAGLFVVVGAIVAQETLFRGWIRRQAGDAVAVVAFAVVCTPLDPLRGVAMGVVLAVLARVSGGSVVPGVLARLLWAMGAWAWPLGPQLALLAAAIAAGWRGLAGGRLVATEPS